VLIAAPALAQRPFDYDRLVDTYATGHLDEAVSQLSRWPSEQVRGAVDLFVKAFTNGLRDPVDGRIRETEWRLALARLRDAIVYCGNCRAENFWDEASRQAPTCWSCRQPVTLPPRLRIDGDTLMLNYDTRVFAHHVCEERFNFDRPVAEVVRHPQNPDVWGLRNLTDRDWRATTTSGVEIAVPPKRSITLAPGIRVNFGKAQGTIDF